MADPVTDAYRCHGNVKPGTRPSAEPTAGERTSVLSEGSSTRRHPTGGGPGGGRLHSKVRFKKDREYKHNVIIPMVPDCYVPVWLPVYPCCSDELTHT